MVWVNPEENALRTLRIWLLTVKMSMTPNITSIIISMFFTSPLFGGFRSRTLRTVREYAMKDSYYFSNLSSIICRVQLNPREKLTQLDCGRILALHCLTSGD